MDVKTKPQRMNDGFTCRCLHSDKKKWVAAAKAQGLTLSQFIVKACNNAVKAD